MLAGDEARLPCWLALRRPRLLWQALRVPASSADVAAARLRPRQGWPADRIGRR
ncbi:hypothetical protein ACTMU2_39495 [Cupriavidus basilensis]